ncbi:SRPBCC family protein [Streptomyces sp. NPDC004647]|uniref:SRPBCC family protein n=1 Tax=Streptomyces sp. NPDC004647 TaxID=3154671 RepID=UPI0033A3F45B
MSTLEEQIDIDVPAKVAWDCLHRVEDYPQFVDGVRHARTEGKHRAHLAIKTSDRVYELDAEILDRGQGRLMMWRTVSGAHLAGTFSVLPLDPEHTRVQIRVEYDPETVKEEFGGPKGFAQASAIERLVRGDLRQLKDLAEKDRTEGRDRPWPPQNP